MVGMESTQAGSTPKLKLNVKRTMLIGFAFFGILLLWQVYDSWCPTFLTEIFKEALHTDNETEVQYLVGIVMALDNLAALIMLPLFGRMSDKTKTPIGKRMPFILLGTAVSAIAFPFIPVCFHYNNVAGVIALMAIVIFFMMMYRSPAVALMPDITPKPLRSKANGIINIMGYLGGAFATLAGIVFVLSDYLGTGDITWATGNIWAIEAPFLIASVLMLVSALVLFFTIKENKLEKELRPEMELGEKEAQSVDRVEENQPLSKANRQMLLLILAAEVFWFMADNAVGTYFGNYVIYYVHASSQSTMITTILMGVASVIGFAAAGFIADKIGRKYTMLIGLGLALAGYFIMCFTLEGHPAGKDEYAAFPWHLYLVYILKGLGMSLVNTCSFPMVVELATGKKVGQFTGYYYAASMGAQTVTPVIVGLVIYLVPDFGWRMLPIYATAMMAVSIAIFMFVKNVKIHNVDTPKGLEAMGDLD